MEDKIKVLLVDDDNDECVIIRDLLSEIRLQQYELEWKSSYDEGLEAILRQEHDVYLIDYRLGARTGLELIREANDSDCVRPMILMTGQGGVDIDMEAMKAGAMDYLDKDQFGPTELERSIRYAIERRKTLEALQEREEKASDMFKGIVETMGDGIMIEDDKGMVIFANEALVSIMGYNSVKDIYKQSWINFFSLEDEKKMENSKGCFESALLTREGKKIPILISSSSFYFKDEYLGVLSVIKDITERKKAEEALEHYKNRLEELVRERTSELEKTTEQLKNEIVERKEIEERIKHLALHDSLTGLPNRYLFFDRLQNALHRAERYKHFVAVLYIDLDGFKDINDKYGHEAGDEALKDVAKRIKSCLRKSDTAARLGGDEFSVIMTDLQDVKYAENTAKRIIESLTEPIFCEGIKGEIGASIGISFYPDHGRKPYILLRKADSAMYKVKNSGKNAFSVYSSASM